MALSQVNDDSLPGFLAASPAPALLCFFAQSSRPARSMLPVLEELSREYGRLVRFAAVDAEASATALDRYGILSLPSYIFIRGGKTTGRFIGAMARDTLVEKIEAALKEI